MNVIAATLMYETPDLVKLMRKQIPDVVVIDNGSKNPLHDADIRIPKNLYFSGGWNAAAQELASAADFIWMLNSDVFGATPDMMQTLAVRAAEHNADVYTPCITGCNHRHMRPQYSSPRRVPWVDWVAPVVRISAFLEEEGFDECLPGYGADIDLCYRLRGRYIVDPAFVLYHGWGTTVKRTGDKTIHQMTKSRDYLYEKYGKAITRFAPTYFRGYKHGKCTAGNTTH